MKTVVDRLASSVAQGKRVDWVKEKSRRPDHHDEIEQLAIVERIRDAHRSATIDAGGPEDETRTQEVASNETPMFRWGSLEALELISQGPGGDVYRAIDKGLHVEVALKLLNVHHDDGDAMIDRFLEEGRRLARVHHQNVLLVHGAGRHGERPGIWTELVRGHSLEQALLNHGALSAGEAAVIGLDLCRALAAIHAAGIVHRDVKASNVMREEKGRIVLMDFGAAAERFGTNGIDGATQGTPIYMAPEQFRGDAGGVPSDIYQLGVLLYHLVTAKYPVEASSYSELVEKHARGERVPLRDRRPDIPLVFVNAVERAIDPDPTQRYQSAGEMEQGISATIRAFGEDVGNQRRFQGFLVGALSTVAAVMLLWAGQNYYRNWSDSQRHTRSALPAVPAVSRLAADIRLERLGQSGELVPLGPEARVARGSQLSMLLRANDSLHVYVLDHDEHGQFTILYPVRGVEPRNPISGGHTHRLPGDMAGKVVYWTVSSVGEKENLIVIGSRGPLPDFEDQIAKLPPVAPGHIEFPSLDAMGLRDVRGLRGIHSGTAQAPPKTEETRRVLDYIGGLEATGRNDGSIFVWRQSLSNPAP